MKKIIVLLFSILLLATAAHSGAAVKKVSIELKGKNNKNIYINKKEGTKEILKFNSKTKNIKYHIYGGVDKDLFILDKETRELSFKKVPDFENPRDSDKNNIYKLIIDITKDKRIYEYSLLIRVKNVDYPFVPKAVEKVHRNKHLRPACKDSRALNFNNVGKHNQDLCQYKEDLEKKLKKLEMALKTLSEKVKTEKKQVVVNKKQSIQKKAQKKKIFQNKKSTIKTVAVLSGGKEESVKENIFSEKKEQESEDKKIVVTSEEKPNTKNRQKASILDSSKDSSWFTWTSIILFLLISFAAWLVWRIFKENDLKY